MEENEQKNAFRGTLQDPPFTQFSWTWRNHSFEAQSRCIIDKKSFPAALAEF